MTYFEESHENVNEIVSAILLSNFALSHLSFIRLNPSDALLEHTLHLLNMAKTFLGLQHTCMSKVADVRLFAAMIIGHNLCSLWGYGCFTDELLLERQEVASHQALDRCFTDYEYMPPAAGIA
jgi:hypothetical protein